MRYRHVIIMRLPRSRLCFARADDKRKVTKLVFSGLCLRSFLLSHSDVISVGVNLYQPQVRAMRTRPVEITRLRLALHSPTRESWLEIFVLRLTARSGDKSGAHCSTVCSHIREAKTTMRPQVGLTQSRRLFNP